MKTALNALAELQIMVTDMERDLGLSDLSQIERKVLLAISDLHAQNGKVATQDILDHKLVESFSRPSLFRALKGLENTGNIKKIGPVRGYYAPAS